MLKSTFLICFRLNYHRQNKFSGNLIAYGGSNRSKRVPLIYVYVMYMLQEYKPWGFRHSSIPFSTVFILVPCRVQASLILPWQPYMVPCYPHSVPSCCPLVITYQQVGRRPLFPLPVTKLWAYSSNWHQIVLNFGWYDNKWISIWKQKIVVKVTLYFKTNKTQKQ